MKHSIIYFLLGNSYIKHEFPMCCVLSRSSRVRHFATLWTVAHQAGSSVHGIFQARILEWIAMPSSSGSSQPRD